MKKLRLHMRNLLLAILCIGLVSSALYYVADAAGHGNPGSSNSNLKLGKDGRKWLTIRVYSTDGKYDSSITGKLPNETGYDTWLSYKFPKSSDGTNTGKDNKLTDTTGNTAATGKSKVSTLDWSDTVGGTFGIRLDGDSYTYNGSNRKSNYVRQAGLSYQFKIGKQKGYHFSATSPALTTSSNIYVAKGDTGIVKAGVAKVKNASTDADIDLQLWKWGNAVDYTKIYNGKGATKTCSVVIDAQDFNESTTINIALAPNTLTINYDGNGGTPSPASQSANYGQTITWNATASGKTGYHVTGWSDESGNAVSLNVSKGANDMAKLVADTEYGIERKNKSATLKASWSPNHYTITYSAPKPTTASTNVSGSTASDYCTYDESYTLPNTGYTLPGYKCNSGWKYSNGTDVGTSQVSNLTATDGATVALHHTWAPRTYTANYNINKPTYATSSSGSTAATTHTFDGYNNLATNGFSCDGATFLGWSRNASAKEFNNTQSVKNLMTPTADGQSINMYAIWRPIQYYVRFNRNWDNDVYITGNTSVTKGKFDYGTAYSAIKQSDTNMSRQGYYIAYWTEKADGTGRRYYCGDKDWPAGQNNVEATFSNLTKTDGATVDLYAHWEPIPYTLVYHKNDSNGGTNPAGGNTASYAETTVRYYNDTKPLLANKWTRVNELNVPSVFRGWNLPADVDSTDNSVKYTARWSNTGNFVNGDSCTLCTTRDGTVDIYTVWDDVPVLIAQDYEIPYSTSSGDTIGDLVSRDSDGGLVLSQTALEEILLKNAVSKHSDREDGVLELGEHFFIKYFIKDTYTDLDSPTSFEVKYTVTDSTGNSYTQSAMLYGGYLIRIDIQ